MKQTIDHLIINSPYEEPGLTTDTHTDTRENSCFDVRVGCKLTRFKNTVL